MAAATRDPRDEWGFLGRRVLVVARFPPGEDGIGRYTDQLIRALEPEREFFRLGIPGGGGDRVDVLWGLTRPLRILRHAQGFDDVLVMYHPAYFHHPLWLRRGAFRSRLVSYASLLVASRLRRTTFVIHEPDDMCPPNRGPAGKALFWLEERIRRALWADVTAVVFHSDWERRRFAERFPPRRRIDRVVTHGTFFQSQLEASRAEARTRLGLAQERVLLLLIGFISPHKGYDRAVRAVQQAGVEGLELHIVGSPIAPLQEAVDHVAELRRIATSSPTVQLHEQFVSDHDFDLWIRAADAVIVPYKTASSSSVVARTQLIGTTLITSGAGGIQEQLRPEDLRFSTDAELVDAIRHVASMHLEVAGASAAR